MGVRGNFSRGGQSWHFAYISQIDQVRNQAGGTGQFPPPKFSKSCLAVRYNNKLQSFSPNIAQQENISRFRPYMKMQRKWTLTKRFTLSTKHIGVEQIRN